MRMFISSILLLALTTTAACKKKDGAAGASSDEAPSAKAAEEKLTWKKLGGMGLEAELPADADIQDTTSGAGFPSATIYATPTTFVSGAGEMSDLKPTIEATKTDLEQDPNKLDKWTKEETTADGWILEGARTSMSGEPLFAIQVRRTIDGKPFDCGTNASSEAERAKATKLCQSLRAAK